MPLPSTDRFNGSPLLPVYLVCDTSTSMGSSSVGAETPIKILNDSIDSLMEIIIRRGNRDIDIHLGIIAFSRFATVVRPLGRIDPREKFKSSLKAEGPTCYEAGLSCLEKCLDEDEENRGRRDAARPLCFFLQMGNLLT